MLLTAIDILLCYYFKRKRPRRLKKNYLVPLLTGKFLFHTLAPESSITKIHFLLHLLIATGKTYVSKL